MWRSALYVYDAAPVMNWFSISTPPLSRELANFTIPIFFNWLLKFIWEYYMTCWSFNNALAHLLAESSNMIYQLPQILPKQNTDFVYLLYQYFKLFFELSFIAWQTKKRYLAKALTKPIDLGIDERSKYKHAIIRQQLTALWSNLIQASSDWQYSSPMMLGIQWGRQSYFRVTTLYHNPAKM